jgi:hypothetical protein
MQLPLRANSPMTEEANTGEERKGFSISPREIAGVLFVLFLLVQGYFLIRDRDLSSAIDNHAPFTQPTLPLEFSRKTAYDPLSFIGRGRQAGLWDWTPEGLLLTDLGRGFFEADGDQFISRASAGKRKVSRISDIADNGGHRVISFFYEWTEVTPAASVLLRPAPQIGAEYPGRAILNREDGDWKVESFEARDFEEPLARLQDIASGVRR